MAAADGSAAGRLLHRKRVVRERESIPPPEVPASPPPEVSATPPTQSPPRPEPPVTEQPAEPAQDAAPVDPEDSTVSQLLKKKRGRTEDPPP